VNITLTKENKILTKAVCFLCSWRWNCSSTRSKFSHIYNGQPSHCHTVCSFAASHWQSSQAWPRH